MPLCRKAKKESMWTGGTVESEIRFPESTMDRGTFVLIQWIGEQTFRTEVDENGG